MKLSSDETPLMFGPYRALLRALLLKQPAETERFLQSFALNPAELMAADMSVARSAICGLWKLAESESHQDPMFPCDAAQIFQFRDLGERGWLLHSASHFSQAFSVLNSFFADKSIEIQLFEETLCCRWVSRRDESQLLPLYFLALSLNSLLVQGIPVSVFKRVVLPQWSAPACTLQRGQFQERLKDKLSVAVEFDGLAIELHMDRAVDNIRFRLADESVYEFFFARCQKQQKVKESSSEHSPNELTQKIRHLLLANLAAPHFGLTEIASKLGVSGRTLERTLSKEKISLRSLRQSVQRETAIELLNMGLRAKEVAAHVGFTDVTAFSRAFSQWTGVSPSQMKRK